MNRKGFLIEKRPKYFLRLIRYFTKLSLYQVVLKTVYFQNDEKIQKNAIFVIMFDK